MSGPRETFGYTPPSQSKARPLQHCGWLVPTCQVSLWEAGRRRARCCTHDQRVSHPDGSSGWSVVALRQRRCA
eukprot:3198190-Prymnesium_polylepis.1